MAKKSTRRRTAKVRSTSKRSVAHSIPELLYAQASPRSLGGMSMFDISGPVGADIVSNFMSDGEVIARAADALSSAGFTILQVSAYTVNVAAPISTYERAFRTKVVPHELDTIKSGGIHDTATFFSTDGASRFGLISTQGTPFESLIEGVAIETPRYFFAAATAMSPKKAYWHLAVPHDVSLGCNADKAHRSGITGRGIKVAMVDSGHFAHPFFAARGYRVQAVTLGPGSSNPGADENGHGTAESANIFAVAPDVELWPVKINFANSAGAFNAAVGLNPDIITCSWGSDVRNGPLGAADQVLAVAIADAVARGIIVIFSAGNGHFGFPGQHPDVISAGGVYRDELGALRASDYASGFASPIYSGRNAPDLCGLVGLRPRAAYIMLPLQPASTIDSGLSGGTHPNADETASDDGWAAISGTSAAAPQLAGTAALIKQACNSLSPASVRDIMMRTAIDVTTGTCNPASSGAAAAVGVDLATGSGLVDAHAAVLVAKIRCLGPITPIRPIVPIQPIQPIQPITPISPIQPIQPITPIQPISPIQPITPIHPISPIQPIRPIRPIEPIVAQAAPSDALSRTQNTGAVEGAPPGLSPEDLKALEELVIKSNIDPLA